MTLALDTDPNLVEDAVKYIIFLVDADSLFDTALGMYDFALVLMIAQHAQKVRISGLRIPLHIDNTCIFRTPGNIYLSCANCEQW